jgi:hypothetical protein
MSLLSTLMMTAMAMDGDCSLQPFHGRVPPVLLMALQSKSVHEQLCAVLSAALTRSLEFALSISALTFRSVLSGARACRRGDHREMNVFEVSKEKVSLELQCAQRR